MYQFIETICVKDGEILHLPDHQKRMNQTIFHFFKNRKSPDLKMLLTIPEKAKKGWYKCRIVYGQNIEEISWEPYIIKEISSLSLVFSDDIDYDWKYANREVFKKLIQKAKTDDIIIVKNGFITDGSYSNLLFHSEQGWVTPSTPLLNGTQRKRLLKAGVIKEQLIDISDLHKFDRIKWINAMLDMENGPEWPMDVIKNNHLL